MSRIAGSNRDVALLGFRRQWVPLLSTLAASLLALFPYVASWPIVPDFAYLVLLAWRLLRPEMWQAHMALPLGLFNDLVAGHPLGQSMAIWTITLLILDFVETRAVFRDFWMDWLLASVLILFNTFGSWIIAMMMGSRTSVIVLWPQLALSILAYPVIARLIVFIDRWRLTR